MKEMTDEERKEVFEKKLKELIEFTEGIHHFYQREEVEDANNFNELWQKYWPHLSPKEAHAKIMKLKKFIKAGEEE